MPRFYIDIELSSRASINLPSVLVQHLHVLRLKKGARIILFNGRGGEYPATVRTLTRHEAQCQVDEFRAVCRESGLWLGIAQALTTQEKMEFVLQKGVEMGVNVFQPLLTQHAALKWDAQKAEQKRRRWQDIVIAASEQSGRTLIPRVEPLQKINAWLTPQPLADAQYILCPSSGPSLHSRAAVPHSVWLMVGPEGGWAQEEIQLACDKGWQPLKLGPRILRTETAALATAAALQAHYGDYKTPFSP